MTKTRAHKASLPRAKEPATFVALTITIAKALR